MAQPRIVVVGLGYVGLPLAIALAHRFETVGIDIDATRIAELERHHDRTNEIDTDRLAKTGLILTSDPMAVAPADVYIITVPTPVDAAKRPDLSIVESASRMVGGMLAADRRPIVCFESTVYPGVTEDICGPILEHVSGLKRGVGFFLGYSPERINPGDREHTIDRITKVVAGETPEITERLAAIYGAITSGGTFQAASIKVAEAAKVIENAQRDINIAFMNEITRIFSLMDISVWDVLRAAGTKWNFLPFQPGLVGGHCIGVDPYYLAHCAAALGHDPAVILSGRAINDDMGAWVADQLAQRLMPASDVLVMGLTFKEDVPDLRNSKVSDVIARLKALGHSVDVADPRANPAEAIHEYGLQLVTNPPKARYDAVLIAVPHAQYRAAGAAGAARYLKPGGLLADLKGLFAGEDLPRGVAYWGI
ncbi:UDP-N-acetyl-D-galactosamine dehydrogenase [Novosphingobium sp. CF614]|uniref:nucleotide sugar dehydrogenase n=1 Tax=Novosphingobium sp. CF614 TaxID=1884364 RepID=UPI0008EA5FBD|nr:nucleotide sugar dehydrogenase [Novosphingobium sp. CF614]SFG21014.1 UDP-N-acetyl-D-galactosamine dehydrogenase [Novosphingobium sp. CF614]